MLEATLESIQTFLKEQELDGVIVPKGEELPLDQLYVSYGLDEQDRDFILQISVLEQDLSGHDEFLPKDLKQRAYKLIQFLLPLPFTVLEQQSLEVARTLLLVNRSLILPGFEFSEVDHAIYYRYLFMTSEEIDERILLQIVGIIAEFTETFSPILEKVSSGEKSLVEVVQDLQE